ncbi:recombinase family protein [Cellulomonas sp. JH27-2]|uniref:recombinase family protein n=1 Tax=Cellulomonas sp. JH27-2 TaxID=2774139 RepID=UPI0017807139|nr:recombinase family protein [Cellulomonas sp. JH27-2]MBD8059053.1 recombinase family protein [Cellulomonas sp. JH27-2]
MDLVFYGRCSTEDTQDPAASRAWQVKRARDLVEPLGHRIVAEYFDIGESRSLPWKRRREATRLLKDLSASGRTFDGIVVGEPQRAFYGAQFALTFPLLTHHGVALFVPEVGGQVDPDSEAHEMVMSLFGGMAKGERNRVKTRTKTSMHELAATTDRHLGGRPPYGYRLADAGPHPNRSKAAAGQRAHRLERDPVTAPHVAHIFDLYAAGEGFRSIAQHLTDAGVPSPSAYDPDRNSHRDPRGWSHGTVRAILANPVYTGVRMWGKQEKFETLMDLDDVAAGNVTRMRWRDREQWTAPVNGQTHEPLVDPRTFEAAQLRLAGGPTRSRTTKPRESAHAYPLRGLLFCECGTRMQGSYRKPARTLYRCELGKGRSLPPEWANHPKTVYLNQDAVLPSLNAWIAETFNDPQWLADQQETEAEPIELVSLRRRLREAQDAIGNIMTAIERGIVSDALVAQLQQRETEKATLEAQVADLARPVQSLTAREVETIIGDVGGIAAALTAATDDERGLLYTELGLRLEYQPQAQLVSATVDLGRVAGRVRRGT